LSDVTFSRVAYPTFRDPATQQREEETEARGHAAGYAAGLRAAAAETAALREALQADHAAALVHAAARTDAARQVFASAAHALATKQNALRTEAQETLVMTALQLAEAIVGYEVRTNPGSTVVAALTRALTVVDPAEVVAVRLHPDDLSLLPPDTAADLRVELVADAGLQRGDAIADLADGFVDAALGTSLARVRRVLTGDAA
jgi:flagellar assembly protein FliH